jgi:hypothetical protein
VREIPPIEVLHLETMSEATVTRAKGVGEGGRDRAPAAVINAINDAISPFRHGNQRNSGDTAAHSRRAARREARMSDKVDITLAINGRSYPIRVESRRTLSDAIRDDCGQTGTHIG